MMMMTAYTSADHLTPLQEQSTVSTVQLNNHDGSECRKPRAERKSSNNDIVCFQCNQVRHKRNQCPMNRNGSVHKTAAMYQANQCVPRHGPNYENMESQQCDNSQGEVQLACACRLPIVAGSFFLV